MNDSADYAVVGAGVLGLAHAYHLARRGRRVVVFERAERAQGASVRNFGMLWPVGQPHGECYDTARTSLKHWLEVLSTSGIWHDRVGSLHLSYREDEEAVLREFAAEISDPGCRLLSPTEAARISPGLITDGLRLALWSPTEVCVDPRQVIAGLPGWLATTHGVRFEMGTAVTAVEDGRVVTPQGTWKVNGTIVCGGDDLASLFPKELAAAGLLRCKLQMMRTAPQPNCWRLGPMLAGGLTLRHYHSFEGCPSLPALKARVAREFPEFDRFGIHVMASQNGTGELILGDSHEYGGEITPFDRRDIDDRILEYLSGFLAAPDMRIAERWHGIYVMHPKEPWLVLKPLDHVTLVTGVGGAGMTLSFGLSDRVVAEITGAA